MIVRSSSNPNLSRPSRSALALAALAALLIFPTWAEPPVEDRGAPSGPAAEQDADTAYRERVRQLEQEAAELENELRGVHARRMEIELEWQQRHLSAELDRLRAQAAELEASGREPEALETLEQARLREVRSQIELERVRLQQEIERQVALHQRSIEHRAIERRLEHAIAEAGEREHRIEAAQLEVEIEHMRATAERLREDGRTEEAARLERQLESMLMERSARESEDRLRSRREIEMLLREASELEARGDDERAREIRAFVEDLLESMEDEAGTIR